MFFKAHGTIPYNMFGNEYEMTDLTKSSITIDKTLSVLISVSVNSRTPEQMANDIYGDAKLYWTILLVNNIIDPFIDWHMPDDQLEEYCKRVYGDDMLKVRYFIDNVTREIYAGESASAFYYMMDNNILLPENIEYVRNYDYEILKNENKKTVNIIPKEYIARFVEDFKSTLKGQTQIDY